MIALPDSFKLLMAFVSRHFFPFALAISLSACSEYVPSFSRLAIPGDIQFTAQQINPDTGGPLVDSSGAAILKAATDLNMGMTPFASPVTVSLYLTNTGEAQITNLSASIDDSRNYAVLASSCGTTLDPTIEGQPKPATCKMDIVFFPISGFSTLSSLIHFKYVTKGVSKEATFPVTGVSLKEPALSFDKNLYSIPGSYAAGAKDSAQNNLYGLGVLILKYNGDLAPAGSSFPSLSFPSGIGSTIAFGQLQALASQGASQNTLNAIISPSQAQSVFFLNPVQDIAVVNPGTLPPLNPLKSSSVLDPCIGNQTSGGTRISSSCYVLVSFAPTFSGSQVFSKNSSIPSNTQATFNSNAALPWNFAGSVLSSNRRTTKTALSGTGINGAVLQPLTMAFQFGTDSTGNGSLTGPYKLLPVSGTSTTAQIVVSPVANSDGTRGVPIRATITNSSGTPAENVSITNLPLPSQPQADKNYYFQSAADTQATTCRTGNQIGPSGCVIYFHFAPSPTGYDPASPTRFQFQATLPAPTIKISYDYASLGVAAGGALTPPVSIAVSATAVGPAHLSPAQTSVSTSPSVFCASSGGIVVTSDGGIRAKSISGSATPNNLAITGCPANLDPGQTCTWAPTVTPLNTTPLSSTLTTLYYTGTTSTYGNLSSIAETKNFDLSFTVTGSANTSFRSTLPATQPLNLNLKGENGYSSCGPAGTVGDNQTDIPFSVCGTHRFSFTPTIGGNFSITSVSCTPSATQSGGTYTVDPSASSSASICTLRVRGTVPTTTPCTEATNLTGTIAIPMTDVITSTALTPSPSQGVRYSYSTPATGDWDAPAMNDRGTIRVGNTSAVGNLVFRNPSRFTLTINGVTATDSPLASAADMLHTYPSMPRTLGAGGTVNFGDAFQPSGDVNFTRSLQVNYTDNITVGKVSSSGTAKGIGTSSVQVTAISPVSSGAIDISFGNFFRGVGGNSNPSPQVTLTIVGSYANWTNSLRNWVPAPWVRPDLTSQCIASPPVVSKGSGAKTCTLSFVFNSAQLPQSAGQPQLGSIQSNGQLLPYDAEATPGGTGVTFATPFNFSVTVKDPSATIKLQENGTDISSSLGLNIGKVMTNTPRDAYETKFLKKHSHPGYWLASQGSQSNPAFNVTPSTPVGYLCKTITMINTASGVGGTAATFTGGSLTWQGATDIILTNATNGGGQLSSSCVDSTGALTIASLAMGASCQMSVCFAPHSVGVSQTANLAMTFQSQGVATGPQNAIPSAFPVRGTGVAPAKVFATGNSTVVVDGLGNAQLTGSGIPAWNSPGWSGISRVSSGDHSFCLISNGALLCGSTANTSLSQVSVAGTPQEVAVGSNHACVLTKISASVNQVYCWGSNSLGQLGIGTHLDSGTLTFNTTTPQLVAFDPLENPISISAGDSYTCSVLLKSGSTITRCWGAASMGQTGIGINAPIFQGSTAVPNPLFAGSTYNATGSGSGTICSDSPKPPYTTKGIYQTTTVCTIPNGALLPSPVLQSTFPLNNAAFTTAAGSSGANQFNCGVVGTSNLGRILCFGQNQDNQLSSFLGLLGPGLSNPSYGLSVTDMTTSLISVPLPSFDTTHPSEVQLAAGTNYTCALYPNSGGSTSSVFCWGRMQNSQSVPANLGATSGDYILGNSAIQGIAFHTPVMLSSGFQHACTVMSDNKVYCWGNPTGFGNIVGASGQSGPYRVQQILDAMQ